MPEERPTVREHVRARDVSFFGRFTSAWALEDPGFHLDGPQWLEQSARALHLALHLEVTEQHAFSMPNGQPLVAKASLIMASVLSDACGGQAGAAMG